jgi:hypothetical protein
MARKTYRSEDGRHLFSFEFVDAGPFHVVRCLGHPPLRGRDPDPKLTHLYPSGNICFVEGREPRSQSEAESRAKEWAEYLLRYIASGKAEG